MIGSINLNDYLFLVNIVSLILTLVFEYRLFSTRETTNESGRTSKRQSVHRPQLHSPPISLLPHGLHIPSLPKIIEGSGFFFFRTDPLSPKGDRL